MAGISSLLTSVRTESSPLPQLLVYEYKKTYSSHLESIRFSRMDSDGKRRFLYDYRYGIIFMTALERRWSVGTIEVVLVHLWQSISWRLPWHVFYVLWRLSTTYVRLIMITSRHLYFMVSRSWHRDWIMLLCSSIASALSVDDDWLLVERNDFRTSVTVETEKSTFINWNCVDVFEVSPKFHDDVCVWATDWWTCYQAPRFLYAPTHNVFAYYSITVPSGKYEN